MLLPALKISNMSNHSNYSTDVNQQGNITDYCETLKDYEVKRCPKNLVLCFDGTQNEFGLMPFTNVLKIFRLLDKDSSEQLCYYQPGVGVKFLLESNHVSQQNFFTSKLNSFNNKVDAMFALSIKTHVIAAYIFLMRFYEYGDSVYLFGFSRGSFTARVLAGMIEKVGLLNNGLEEMTLTAWELYSNWENDGQPAQKDISTSLVDEFKETFSRKKVEIFFMGLWDSVNSVGLITDQMFPYTSRSAIVKHVRHAVSIDERRGKYKQVLFKPFCYHPKMFNSNSDSSQIDVDGSIVSNSSTPLLNSYARWVSHKFRKPSQDQAQFKSRNNDCYHSDDIVELWFPGNHGDVGGGWPPDLDGQYLSDIPLRWMISEALKFGVKFKPGSIHDFDSKHQVKDSLFSCHHDMLSLRRSQKTLHRKYFSAINVNLSSIADNSKYHVFENHENFKNCLRKSINHSIISISNTEGANKEPIMKFDSRGDESLFKTFSWWLIELLPVGIKIEDKDGKWTKVRVPNLGRHRTIPQEACLHWSVFYRMHFISDYDPSISDNQFGRKFRKSLKPFKNLYGKEQLNAVSQFTKSTIKSGNEYGFWDIIPDELSSYLEADPTL